jgi:Lamin Tail Domain
MPHRGSCPLIVLLAICAPPDRARIAEVFYDAIGDDTGREFVELYNPGTAPASLAGVKLEAGDGAGPGRWTTRWTGAAGDSIGAGARFVIGGALVVPPPNAVVTLALQNGPDAVRLRWPDGVLEVVGYGALTDSEYFCGAPAADVTSGLSLARVPDDADRGSNALDFLAREPTPGAPNEARLDAAIETGSLALDPEQPAVGATSRLSATLIDRGTAALAAGLITLSVTDDGVELTTLAQTPGLDPEDSARVTLELPGLSPGKHALVMRATLSGDARPANDADTLLARIGPGALEITEIQFHPAAGEGEWIEVRAADAAGAALEAFTLSDRGLHPGTPQSALQLPGDSLALLVQDRAALLARYPLIDATRVVEVKPWSALNNTDDSTGIADVVSLRERDGTPCDRVAYSAHGVPAGVPLELVNGTWKVDSAPAGTPLAPPQWPAPIAGRFELVPRRLKFGENPRLIWSLPWTRCRISIDAFDLAGRRVGHALESDAGPRGVRSIDFLPGPGLYVFALDARATDGGARLLETHVVRVEGAAR